MKFSSIFFLLLFVMSCTNDALNEQEKLVGPYFSLTGGVYDQPVTLSLYNSNNEAMIKFTMDGSIPGESYGHTYTSPIEISNSMQIKAVAVQEGFIPSLVVSNEYMIKGTLANPILSPGGGVYSNDLDIGISCSTPGVIISLSTNGGLGWEEGTNFVLTGSVSLQVRVEKSLCNTVSIDARYDFLTAVPRVSVPAGVYEGAQTIYFSSATTGAVFQWSTNNGSSWIEGSSIVLSNSCTLSVKAARAGFQDSAVVSAAYTIKRSRISAMYFFDEFRLKKYDPHSMTTITVINAFLDDVQYLYLDSINSKIYWTDFVNGRIRRANYDGSGMETLFPEQYGLQGIAVDSYGGKIYWVQSGVIKRGNLDGTGMETIVTAGLSSPSEIAIDPHAGRLYIVDSGDAAIKAVQLDGFGLTTVLSGVNYISGIDLDTSRSNIYWTQSGSIDSLKHASYAGGNTSSVSSPYLGNPGRIFVDAVNEEFYWLEQKTTLMWARMDGSITGGYYDLGYYSVGGIDMDFTSRKIYWYDTIQHAIRWQSMNNMDKYIVLQNPLLHPNFSALDSRSGKIYWTDYTKNPIMRANTDGSGRETLVSTNVKQPAGIVLDTTTDKMYWTEYGNNVIKRANLDGSGIETVVSSGLSGPMGIVIDLSNAKMYWVERGSDTLKKADLDGGNVSVLVSTGISTPLSITLDPGTGTLYWSEYDNKSISSVKTDGSGRSVFISAGLSNPDSLAIDIEGGRLYWADLGNKSISSIRLDGTERKTVLTGLNWPKAILFAFD